MTIRSRGRLSIAITIIVFLVYGGGLLCMNRTITHLIREVHIANGFQHKISVWRTLTQNYLLYKTDRAREQWLAVYAEVARMVQEEEYRQLQQGYDLGDISDKVEIAGDAFSRLVTATEAGPPKPGVAGSHVYRNRLTTQLLLATQDLLNRFATVETEAYQRLLRIQRQTSFWNILTLLILGLVVISNAVLLQRTVVQPILKLHKGAEIIGSGNFNFQIGLTNRDEIGALSRAFDRMTANIRELTVFRDELVAEVAERQKVEAALLESREDLNRAQAVAHTGSWRLNVPSNILTWSDENHRIFGIPPGISMSYETFLGSVYAKDRDYVDQNWMAALRGEHYDIEHRIIVGDRVKWVRERAELEFDELGKLVGGFGTTQDITRRKEYEEVLTKSLAEKTALLKEVHHRVKNNLQIVISLLSLQANRLQNREAYEILEDTRSRVHSMALLHEMLYRSGNLARINFATYVAELLQSLWRSFGPGTSRISLETRVAPLELPMDLSLPCGLIINELVSNALKHAFPGERLGRVTVGLDTGPLDHLTLTVQDDGVGPPAGIDFVSSSTLGWRLVSRLAAQMQGKLTMSHSEGFGTAINVVFPAPAAISSQN